MNAISTLTSKGQITIPEAIRRRLGLKTGDRLKFSVDEEGLLRVARVSEPHGQRVFGLLRRYAPEKAVTVEEMREAVRERARGKHGQAK